MQLNLAFTTQPLARLSGGLGQPASAAVQELVLQLKLGTGLDKEESLWREQDRWSLNLEATQVFGDTGLASGVGAVFPLQSDALPEQLYLSQLSVERKAPVGGFGIKLGMISLDPEMISAPAYDFYVHSALDDTYNLAVPGYGISPYSNPGLLLTYRPSKNTQWRYGIYDLNEQEYLNGYGNLPSTPLESIQGWLQVLQFEKRWSAPDARLKQRNVAAQLPDGLLQIGGFLSSTSSQQISSWGTQLGPSQGTYASLTLPLELPFGLAHRFWAGTLVGFSPSTNPVTLYGHMGWLAQGVLPSRPLDVLVLGYGRSVFSPVLGLQDESVLELGYQIAVSPNLVLQPTLQWIFNPGGQGLLPVVTAAGLQVQLQF